MPEIEYEKADSRIEFTKTSRVIFVGPCFVEDLMLSGDGAQADCQVYEGQNANGDLKVHLEALSGTTFNFNHPGGVLFRKGLYIAVNAVTSKVSVILKPAIPKKM